MKITTMAKRVALPASLLCGFLMLPASAAADVVDLGQLPNGQPVEYPGNYNQVQGYFIVEQDGKVQAQFTGTVLQAYSDPEHTQEMDGSFSYINAKPTKTYTGCTVGQTIYFYNNFVMDAGTVTVTNGDLGMKLESCSPSLDPDDSHYYGGAFSIAGGTRISLQFNLNVTVSSATVNVNGVSANLSPICGNNCCEIFPAEAIMRLYKNGNLKGGDTATFRLTGICETGNSSNLLNGTGVLEISYVMAPRPIELEASFNTPQSGTPDFLSYYLPENPLSTVKLQFSGNVASEGNMAPYANIIYGDPDDIEAGMYYEKLDATVEGNTVSFDLAGKLRRPIDMVPLLAEEKRPDQISLVVYNVHDTEGQRCYLASATNPASIPYSYHLVVLQYNVASDFTPMASKGLTGGEPMEIFIMEGAYLTFSGVNFTYMASGNETTVTVLLDQLSIEADSYSPETDIVVNLTVPELEGIDAGSPVTVSMAGLSCADGLDHNQDVECTYQSFTSGISPVNTAVAENKLYNLFGLEVNPGKATPGIYIRNGKKITIK